MQHSRDIHWVFLWIPIGLSYIGSARQTGQCVRCHIEYSLLKLCSVSSQRSLSTEPCGSRGVRLHALVQVWGLRSLMTKDHSSINSRAQRHPETARGSSLAADFPTGTSGDCSSPSCLDMFICWESLFSQPGNEALISCRREPVLANL